MSTSANMRRHPKMSKRFKLQQPHESDIQKRRNLIKLRRPHFKRCPELSEVKVLKNINRCFHCHFWNLRGRLYPVGFAKAELTSNLWKNKVLGGEILIDALIAILGSTRSILPRRVAQAELASNSLEQ